MKFRLSLALATVLLAASMGIAGPELSPEYDIVVIGAGPAGLTAALEARASGARVLVIEKRRQSDATETREGMGMPWASRTRVLSLEKETSETLRALHVATPQQPLDASRVRVASAHSPDAHVVAAELERSIYEKAVEQGVEFAFNAEPSIDPDSISESSPHAEIHVSRDRKIERITSKLVIVADGARSPTASNLGIKRIFQPEVPDRISIGADFEFPDTGKAQAFHLHYQESQQAVHVVGFSAQGTLSLSMPAPEAVLHADDSTSRLSTAKTILESAADRMGNHGKMRSSVYTYSIGIDSLETVRKGYVFFIGDAARKTNPMTGMGVNFGIADAHAVGDLARALVQGPEALAHASDKFVQIVRFHSKKSKRLSITVLTWKAHETASGAGNDNSFDARLPDGGRSSEAYCLSAFIL